MAKKLDIKKIGVVENMSGLICPHCGKGIDIFDTGGGEKMANEMGVAFLGRIPLEMKTREGADAGNPVVLHNTKSRTEQSFAIIAENTTRLISV